VTQNASKRPVLLGLIGQDIQASRTPEMREGEAQGLRLIYRIIDLTQLSLGVKALPELLTAAQRMSFDGLNWVTCHEIGHFVAKTA
jgi:shikimate dehydrogenase